MGPRHQQSLFFLALLMMTVLQAPQGTTHQCVRSDVVLAPEVVLNLLSLCKQVYCQLLFFYYLNEKQIKRKGGVCEMLGAGLDEEDSTTFPSPATVRGILGIGEMFVGKTSF